MTRKPRLHIVAAFAVGLFVGALGMWFTVRQFGSALYEATARNNPPPTASPIPTFSLEPTVTPSLLPSPSPEESTEAAAVITPQPSPTETSTPQAGTAHSNGDELIIPVAGVRREDLQDTYDAARSEGRVHDAIDIVAPRGTPVLAAADGTIVKLFRSEKGGTTLYQLAPDNRTVYYYAHLDSYADGVAENKFIRRGETIAYVGDSGNAIPGNCHLHFAVSLVPNPKDIHNGVNINPYPLLTKR